MQRIGPYSVERELSRGGMGVVYRAHDPQLDRPVAIKVLILAGYGQDSLDWARFQQEARTTARLRHPNIVGIHSAGQAEGHPYLVLDLIEGGSLHDRIQRDGALESREAARIARAIADALYFAHEQGILHRDLKPQNVLLEGGTTPVLADFGLSKLLGVERSGFTATGEVVGSPAYMSPEQAGAKHERLGVATDVYGAGATLYAMLTGRPPFHEADVVATLESVRSRAPVAPATHQPAIDPELESICLRCLAKKPEDRYPSAFALRAALDLYLERGFAAATAPPAASAVPARKPLRGLGLVLCGALVGWSAASLPGWLEPGALEGEALRVQRRGSQRYDRGDFQGAEEDWSRTLELAPENPMVWFNRSGARLGQEEFEGALADLDRAESLEPADPESLHFLRGKIYTRKKDYAQAIAWLDKAIALRPDDPVFHVQRGFAKEETGDAEGALADYARSIELDPRLKGSHHRRGCVYFEQGKFDEALEEADAALRMDGKYSPALTVQGMVFERRGDPMRALELYEAALTPSLGDLKKQLCNRASTFLLLKDWRAAAIDSALALQGDPEHAEAYLMRGVAQRAMGALQQNGGRMRSARALYERALSDFESSLERTQDEEERRALREEMDALGETIRRLSSGR